MTSGVFSRQFYFLQKWCGGASPSFEQLSHKINTAPFSASLKYSNKYRIYQDFQSSYTKHKDDTEFCHTEVWVFFVFFKQFSLKFCSTNSKLAHINIYGLYNMIHRFHFFFFLKLNSHLELSSIKRVRVKLKMQTESFGPKDSCCAGLDFCGDPSPEAPFRSDRCAHVVTRPPSVQTRLAASDIPYWIQIKSLF